MAVECARIRNMDMPEESQRHCIRAQYRRYDVNLYGFLFRLYRSRIPRG